MKRRAPSVPVFAAIGVVALCASLLAPADGRARPQQAERPQQGLVVGAAPPPLALDRVAGTEAVTLAGLRGRVVVLDFWATWCSACRMISPALDSMYRQHQAQGLSVVGLSPEADSAIRAHLRRAPVQYTIARDVGGTVQAYGVRGIPTLVVIDRRGNVRDVMIGVEPQSMQRLTTLVTRLIAEPAP